MIDMGVVQNDPTEIVTPKRILKPWPEILTHCMKKKASLSPGSIYFIPFNLNVSTKKVSRKKKMGV